MNPAFRKAGRLSKVFTIRFSATRERSQLSAPSPAGGPAHGGTPICAILALAVTACDSAAQTHQFEVRNDLSSCIELISAKSHHNGQSVFATIDYKILASTAECGCKSKLSAYSAYAKSDGYNTFLIGGKILFQENEKLELPLSTDKDIIGDRALLLTLTCAQPD
jgi:hypothetical protein